MNEPAMKNAVRRAIVVVSLIGLGGACGGPKQYVQVERPTACQPGAQPAIVEFKFDSSGSIDPERPIWECRPSCGADKEYVSLVRTGPSVRP